MDAQIRSIYLKIRQIIIQNDSVLNEFALAGLHSILTMTSEDVIQGMMLGLPTRRGAALDCASKAL
jgi:hypothetical protein